MKQIYKIFLIAFVGLGCLHSCDDWTEKEPKDPAKLVGSIKTEEFYKRLREYKKTKHPMSFGWFGNWTGTGVSYENSLAGLPDSTDFVSLWGGWGNPTKDMLKDLRFVQKTKGTKAVIAVLLFDIGGAITPEMPKEEKDKGTTWEQWRYKFWGWEEGNEEAINKAIVKYANAFCDSIEKYDYDGFDLDAEPSYPQPFETKKELWNPRSRVQLFVETLSKRIGPKSGTGKLLVVDGEPDAFPAEMGDYFDYFILQAYGTSSFGSLDGRFQRQYEHFKEKLSAEEIANKLIVCENFERYAKTGGVNFRLPDGKTVPSLIGFAHWNPTVNGKTYTKGGLGSYHMEYEYNVGGKEETYPFLREAIRIMNPVIK